MCVNLFVDLKLRRLKCTALWLFNRSRRGVHGCWRGAKRSRAVAQSRLPAILLAHYGPEQKQAAAEFEAARKILVSGPFVSLMYSPQVMTQAQALGGPLRCEPAMGTALSELAILLTAQRWTQD